MKRKVLVHTVILVFFAGLVWSQVPPAAPPQDHPIALVGATLHPVSGPEIPNGTLLFERGRITGLGTDVTLPPGTEVIRLEGKHVYPGLIDADSIIGLVEIGAVRATRDYQETGVINPNVRAETAINPDSEIIPVTRANGVLIALVVPRGPAIAGRSAAIMLDGWTWEEMTLKAPVGLHVYWPRLSPMPRFFRFMPEQEQRRRAQENLRRIKQAFREARAYYVAKKAAGRKGVPHHEVDLRWEAMVPVFEGKLPVFVHADTVDQIETAVAWVQQEGLRMVLVGGRDADRVAGLLKEKGIPVIVRPILRLPSRRWVAYDEPFALPAKLHAAGVRFCIAGDGSASNERNLPYHAAMAVAFGLPAEEGLKAITLYPAQILGIDDRVGTLEVGKDATLFVSDGNPLDIRSRVEMAFIQGRKIDLYNRHQRLYEKYREKYRQRKAAQKSP